MATFLTCQSDEFPKKGAELLEALIRESIASRGVCKLGFSGGSTPKDVYKALATSSSIDWSKVIAFLVDERCIPATQADSNQYLLSQAGLLALPARWILPKTELSPLECARNYSAQLDDVFRSGEADVLTLGLGEDGHIASLFPPLPREWLLADASVIWTHTDRFAVRDRVTLTLPRISNSRACVFFLKGMDKLAVWKAMMASPLDVTRWPAHQVIAHGRTTVLGHQMTLS
jgi:6-phosphogluconolactonase